MKSSAKKTSRVRAQGRRHSLFAYSVPLDRIRSLASDLSEGDQLTVLSPKRLSGLHSRQLERVALSDGRDAVALVPETDEEMAQSLQAVVPRVAFEPDARGRAILRGLEYAQADLSDAGGAYSLEQVREVLRGVTRQAIDKRVRDGSLLAVPGPSNRRRYPTFQFNADGAVVDGLKQVQDAMPTKNAWAVLNFLVNPQDGLGGVTPISVLRSGEIDKVVATARRVGDQGG